MAPKRIPTSRIMEHFFKLREEQRVELLKKNLSPKLVTSLSANEFYPTIYALRSMPEKEARAFIKKHYGDSKEHLKKTVAHGEELLGGFKDMEYTQYGAKTDEDKLYAQIRSETLGNRLRVFYDDLSEKDKAPYIRKALATMDDTRKVAYILEDPMSFEKGKSPETFLEDVMKTMDLSKEKSMMENLRETVSSEDPERKEKIQCLAQQYMLFSEGRLNTKELAEKLQGKDWTKNFNIQKKLASENSFGRASTKDVLRRIKSTMNGIPETEEEKALFKEAALQSCKDFIKYKEFSSKTEDPTEKEFLKFTKDLQEELAIEGLKQKPAQEIQESLAREYDILKKEKSGWFLSKTNSPEYNNMMKHLRLFNAKLDLINGKQPQEALTEEELQTVKTTDVDVLLSNAKQGCYNYGSLKTKNGTSGFLHEAGSERFTSSMKTLSHLNKLGKELHLSDSATDVRDEAQLQVLSNRRNGEWLSKNLEDAVAKTICSQVLLNRKMPAYQQRSILEGDALNAQVEKIKSQKTFQNMMKSVSKEKLADALIHGGNSLYEVYNKAVNTAKADGHQRTKSEIEPDALMTGKENLGLVPGRR